MHFVCVCVCVDEIISLPWFSKELQNDLSNNNCLRGVILILLIRESIFVGWGFPFPILLVPRYKLSLCHTLIKPDLLGFPGIGVFACGLRDHVITRFPIREKSSKSSKPRNFYINKKQKFQKDIAWLTEPSSDTKWCESRDHANTPIPKGQVNQVW